MTVSKFHFLAFTTFYLGLFLKANGQNPLDLPLLQFEDISYAGAFKIPSSGNVPSEQQTDYSIGTMGYNPGTPGSIFISCHPYGNWAAEISIPEPDKSTNLSQLKTASFLQRCQDPLAGSKPPNVLFNDPNGYYLGGFLPYKGKLIVTAYLWYDGSGSQTASHYVKATTNLTTANAVGPYDIFADGNGTGYISGYMHPIPSEWQSQLGGPILVGQNGFSIISRGSYGPDAFSFDPDNLGKTQSPSKPLFYYPEAHPTLGGWDATYDGVKVKWNQTGWYKNMLIIDGTRTALAFGHQGIGPYCYGEGGPGFPCADPDYPDDKGDHAYPYRLQIMAYDVKDMADVSAGLKKPWEVQPYAIWPINPPFGGIRGGGAGWDPVKRRVYFAVLNLDESRPILYAYDVTKGNTSIGTTPPKSSGLNSENTGYIRVNGTSVDMPEAYHGILFNTLKK
jgi:hypothetical protein